jgi:hypothetical protein
LLFKKVKVRININIILTVVLTACRTWSLTLREGWKLKVCENTLLRRILGPKRDEVTGEWRNYIRRSFMLCTPHQILFEWLIKKNEMSVGR